MKFATVLEAAAHFAERAPDKICLIEADSGLELTYADFFGRVRSFASVLRGAGLKKGGRVAVRVGNLLETLVAQFGVYLAGGVYCPLETNMKETKLLEMIEYFGPEALVSTERAGFGGTWIDLREAREAAKVPPRDFNLPDPDDLCSIVFTTGTTGKAKGVMLSFKAQLHTAETWRDAFGVTEKDVFLWVAPLDRVNGVRAFGPCFISGGTAVYQRGAVFVSDFFSNVKKYRVTGINIQSFAIGMILRTAPEMFASFRNQIRYIYFSAGPMSESHKRQMQKLLPETELFINYGATEISNITNFSFSRHPNRTNSVGKPYPGTELKFLDEGGFPKENVSHRDFGIIACKNDSVMSGYWKEPELTNSTIVDGYVVMADVGYRDDDGFVYLAGRRDDVIVSGGHKIAPYEVENIASQIPGVSECVCIPREDKIAGFVPVLIVAMEEGAEFSAKEIAERLAERIEGYKMPRSIHQINEMPRVGNTRKIDRRKLHDFK